MVEGQLVVVSGSWDETVRLWEVHPGREPIGELDLLSKEIKAAAIGTLDTGPVIVSGSKDGTIHLWDATIGEPLDTRFGKHTFEITSVAFGNVDGRAVVISGSRDGSISLWDACTGQPIGEPFKSHGKMRLTAAILERSMADLCWLRLDLTLIGPFTSGTRVRMSLLAEL